MRMLRKVRLFRYSVATLPLFAVLSGCNNNANQAPAMPPTAVTVVTLKNSSVNLLREMPGRVSAHRVAEVRPQVGGIVKRVLFSEGSQITAGQVLYELDDAPYRTALNNAQATRLKAAAALESAQRNAKRGSELSKTGLISTQENEDLQTVLHQAEADLAAADAALDGARINLGYARITAPIAGRIGKSTVTQGALVVANQGTALATIQQIDQVYVDVTQSSSEWLQLRSETDGKSGSRSVKIVLEDGSTHAQEGLLQFTDVSVDPGTGSILLRILVPNAKAVLLPGMYVRAIVNEGVLNNALLAPQQGITRDPRGNATAMVVGADSKVEQRTVKTLRTLGDQWLISDGLQAGDQVIVEGLQKIQVGAPVQATEAGATPATATPATPATPAAG